MCNISTQVNDCRTHSQVFSSAIHKQPSAKKNMNDFQTLINRFSIYQCSVCKEAWPINQKVSAVSSYVCKRCKDDKQKIKKYSNENFMIPGAVPSVLENLTQIEEM